ncbi:MAG: hypothetical protein WCI53_02585, partial [Bacteroidota bacterium]
MYKTILFFLFASTIFACGNQNKTNAVSQSIDSVAIKAGAKEISEKINENPTNAALYFERGSKYFEKNILERAE